MKYLYTLITVLVIILSGSFLGQAQTKVYEYAYDNSGNRIQRQLIQLKSAQIVQNQGTEQQQEILEDTLNGHDVKIFPNPTKAKITVSISGLENEKAQVYIFNSGGKLISNEEFSGSENSVNLSKQPAGLYLMKIIIGEYNAEWKIIKE